MADEGERLRRTLANALEHHFDVVRMHVGQAQLQFQADGVPHQHGPREREGGAQEEAGVGPGLLARVGQFMAGWRIGGGGVATERMVREALTLREKDDCDPSTSRYSRYCIVCFHSNPRQRAVFTQCGHIVCYPCAVDNARKGASGGKCVYCRSKSAFVKLFEEECNGEARSDVVDENRTAIVRTAQSINAAAPLPPPSTDSPASSPIIDLLVILLVAVVMLIANLTAHLR